MLHTCSAFSLSFLFFTLFVTNLVGKYHDICLRRIRRRVFFNAVMQLSVGEPSKNPFSCDKIKWLLLQAALKNHRTAERRSDCEVENKRLLQQ